MCSVGTARANPKDERLFALAEVRDLTPVLDEHGTHVALPELEQVLVEVLETIREFQARRPLHRRLMWNRVMLHVWPVIHLDPDEIRNLVARLTPSTAGLGLEMLCVHGRVAGAGRECAARLMRFFADRARGHGRDRRSTDAAASAARRGRAADHLGAPSRDAAPGGDRADDRPRVREPAASRPGSSSSTTSMTTAVSSRSIGHPPPTPAGSSSA